MARRDPERTREQILDAALHEFGEHGYAGARTAAIAARAGVNQQLISYHFGGKAGLHQAVIDRWPATGAPLRDGDLAEVVANFVRAGAAEPAWGRMLVWSELTGELDAESRDTVDNGYLGAMVDDLRARQERGELAADLDPAYVQLMLFAATVAPYVLSRTARGMTGLDPASPEFVERYAETLGRVVARLQG
ncbi:TetR/AcrR family transcriptional regulator [Pseudonocardia sp. CA-107938]|uniref:TetR/AcrR family transcriptional regulator n=1 Tax=Pseudonocardia sp. CA-107938 TaxID=3240021 RepID=UPI003D89FED6